MNERQTPHSLQPLADRIERGSESKRTVERLVRIGTEESYDWLTTTEVLSIGASAATKSGKSREAGLQVLRGVNTWLENAPFGIVYKTLLPYDHTADDASEPEEERYIVNSRNLARLRNRVQFLGNTLQHPFFARHGLGNLYTDFAEALDDHMKREPLDQNDDLLDAIPYPLINNLALFALLPDQGLSLEEVNHKQQAIIAAYHAARSTGQAIDHMRYADTVIQIAPTIPPLGNNPQMMDVRIGRVSLSELYQAEGDAFIAAYLEFIANMPKGDLLSHALTGIAFIPQYGRLLDIPDEIFQDPEFSNKLFMAQCTLIDHLVTPAASKLPQLAEFVQANPFLASVDRGLDAGLRTAVTHLNGDQQVDFATALSSAALFGDVRQEMLAKSYGKEQEEAFGSMQFDPTTLTSAAAHYLTSRDPHATFRSHEVIIQRLLSEVYPQMEVNWKQRFETDYEAMRPFFSTIRNACEVSMEEIHADRFLSIIRENLGENFVEQLESHSDELATVTQEILRQLYRQPRKFWPSDSALHRIDFGKKSLPGILGMENVSYKIPDDPTQPIHFILRFEEDKIHIPGTIVPTEDGNSISLGMTLPENAKALSSLMEHIALSYFYDLLITSGELARKKGQSTKKGTGMRMQDKRKERKVRLPRPERTDEIRWDSEALTDTVSGLGEKPIRRITMHVRGVPGSLPFMRAVGSYLDHAVIFEGERTRQNPNAEESVLTMRERRIQNTWSSMSHPSPEKLAVIARMPKVWRSEIRYIGDRPIDTVVADHWNPRPPDEIIGSPDLMYAAYYSAPTASKTAYLDYLSLWMFGDDMGREHVDTE